MKPDRPKILGIAGNILVDVGWGLLLAALLAAVVLFSANATSYVYVAF